jgi:hypothetical protein
MNAITPAPRNSSHHLYMLSTAAYSSAVIPDFRSCGTHNHTSVRSKTTYVFINWACIRGFYLFLFMVNLATLPIAQTSWNRIVQ